MDSMIRKLEKVGSSMGSVVDHEWIRILVITILVVYNSGLFVDFNLALSPILNNTLFRLVLLILVVYMVPKNPTIAVLLVLTLACSSYYRGEHFENAGGEGESESESDEEEMEQKGKGKVKRGNANANKKDVQKFVNKMKKV
jgi:hypothetical protein